MSNKFLIKINISSSFIYRTQCIRCGSQPSYYYFSRNPILWYDPNKNKNIFEFVKKYCKRLSPDNFIFDDFRSSSKIGNYNHPVNYKGYKPRLHKSRGVNPVFNVVEHLMCDCGYTIWSFTNSGRVEIINRKSRHKKQLTVLT